MIKNFWTPAEEKVLKLLQDNKKDFLRYCWREWGFGFVCTQSSTVGWQALLRKRAISSPALADNLLVVGRAVMIKVKHCSHWGMTEPEKITFIEKLYAHYLRILFPSPKPFAQLYTYTETVKELLERGFIDQRDCDMGVYHFRVQCYGLFHYTPCMRYSEALELATRVAIPNKYSIILWKSTL